MQDCDWFIQDRSFLFVLSETKTKDDEKKRCLLENNIQITTIPAPTPQPTP